MRGIFFGYGVVLSIQMPVDSSGKSMGYALVHYGDVNESRLAIKGHNGKIVCGKQITVRPYLGPRYTKLPVQNVSEPEPVAEKDK